MGEGSKDIDVDVMVVCVWGGDAQQEMKPSLLPPPVEFRWGTALAPPQSDGRRTRRRKHVPD